MRWEFLSPLETLVLREKGNNYKLAAARTGDKWQVVKVVDSIANVELAKAIQSIRLRIIQHANFLISHIRLELRYEKRWVGG
jgi:hypothetical protein